MELNRDEKVKACTIAANIIEKRSEQFKPANKPVIKNETGWICEQMFRGSVGDLLMCGVKLQWNYPAAGAVGRIIQVVHVSLRCIINPHGYRMLRLVSTHLPQYDRSREDNYCALCGDDFNDREEIKADTSLHEF